ncbi:hypothetical protein [Nocardioides convexus]|uniref:hypothetical protein n=1 Tax=Nocardioides convexus TaxID=2712224 RepID=UPI002418A496|nr:hypothetical protein [Nocardioides convexus]
MRLLHEPEPPRHPRRGRRGAAPERLLGVTGTRAAWSGRPAYRCWRRWAAGSG